jgi:hypothetical protein
MLSRNIITIFGFLTVRAELQTWGKNKPVKPKPAAPFMKERRENLLFVHF